MTRLLTEIGFGTSLRRQDYTQAAKRGIEQALWKHSINLAELYDLPKEAMEITVDIGVQQPDQIDAETLKAVFPYGQITINPTKGGLDVARPGGNPTVMATIAISVALPIGAAP